jgi:hypothetical protein
MAIGDVWGNSWASSWGLSWGQAEAPPEPPPTTERATPGNTRWDRQRKRKHRVIRFSDFETREALAAEIAAAALPIVSIPLETTIDEWEEIEDDFIAFELMRLLS